MTDRVACVGECMIELVEQRDGTLRRGWGGDTLNTAVYLARLGIAVDYVTALGDDAWSEEMVIAWRAEGIGTALVHRLPGQLPGLYLIQTGDRGERRFSYWRDAAAARRLFDHLDPGALAPFGWLYLSGISLSIYDDAGRAALFAALEAARARGARVAFDTNFRPRGWPDRARARQLYRRMLGLATLVLASVEDLEMLFDAEGDAVLRDHAAAAEEVVLKLPTQESRVRAGGQEHRIKAPAVADVRDTTAAGDSFAAAYLAARLRGATVPDAARAGHRLAAEVVRHPGAIIPRAAMPPDPSAAPGQVG